MRSENYPASLELHKIYRTVQYKGSGKLGLLRVIDESGEDYLYPSEDFIPIKIPRAVARAMQLAS